MSALVLDANILIRAVLGKRVPKIIGTYAGQVEFFAPVTVFEEAREKLPQIVERRGLLIPRMIGMLDLLAEFVQSIESEMYLPFETLARELMDRRDQDDWPVLATALALSCPIWTEDTDFFGCGVPTWTTDRIEIYLQAQPFRALTIALIRPAIL